MPASEDLLRDSKPGLFSRTTETAAREEKPESCLPVPAHALRRDSDLGTNENSKTGLMYSCGLSALRSTGVKKRKAKS